MPVIFGPEYYKFKEAKDLIVLKGAFSISGQAELKSTMAYITEDEAQYAATCQKLKQYVEEHTGATEIIVGSIRSL